MKCLIVVSAYKKPEYLVECFDSILAQTYTDYNVIFVNDSGNDENINIALKYQNDNFMVNSIDNEGLSRTRDVGVKLSKDYNNEYILFIDGDDKIDPTFLEKTVKVMDENPEIGVVYSDTQHFDGADSHWDHPEYDFNRLLYGNFLSSCSLIRKKAYDEAGGFDENNFGFWEDYQFFIKLGSLKWYGKHIPEKLFYYRIHAKSGMQSKRNAMLGGVYKAYIISQFPKLYDPDLVNSANNILSMYPENFMKFPPEKQEKYLEDFA